MYCYDELALKKEEDRIENRYIACNLITKSKHRVDDNQYQIIEPLIKMEAKLSKSKIR